MTCHAEELARCAARGAERFPKRDSERGRRGPAELLEKPPRVRDVTPLVTEDDAEDGRRLAVARRPKAPPVRLELAFASRLGAVNERDEAAFAERPQEIFGVGEERRDDGTELLRSG
jgi:hypothetical protein